MIGSVAQASQLDDLIAASSQIAGQVDRGNKLVGAAVHMGYDGNISNGTLSSTAHITAQDVEAYNYALDNISGFSPYGDTQTYLENAASAELDLMHDAVEVFSGAVVELVTVTEVADMAASAETPNEQAAVQDYVQANVEALKVDQTTVDTYNQSIDDIETHANNAGAYLGVAANKEAVAFLEQGAASSNTTVDTADITYSANQQWVKMTYSTGAASAVFVNGTDSFGVDLYLSEAGILDYGAQSDYYLAGANGDSYDCYSQGECP